MKCLLEPLGALGVLRPDQGSQPKLRLGIRDAERVEINAQTPSDLRQDGRKWGKAISSQRTGNLDWRAKRPIAPSFSIVIAVTIPEQIEPGTAPNLHQGKRLSLRPGSDKRKGRDQAGHHTNLVRPDQASGENRPEPFQVP